MGRLKKIYEEGGLGKGGGNQHLFNEKGDMPYITKRYPFNRIQKLTGRTCINIEFYQNMGVLIAEFLNLSSYGITI